MSVVTLVCSCGMRLKAPGAVPGRVGKCPRCGSMLKVPDRPTVPDESKPADLSKGRPTFIQRRGKKSQADNPKKRFADGMVRPPTMAETRWQDSLTYPLWNASGLAILAFMPVALWFATVPLFALVPTLASGSAFAALGSILFIPQFLFFAVVVGYILLFLGQVLVTSALGEVAQPRTPGWSFSEIGQGLGRWFWALLVGGAVGGLPAMLYWINCGDVDWLDRIVLVDLVVPGLAYAQMALLAALIFESPLASNPYTVIRAILRVGWAYVSPCVMTGSVLIVLVGLFEVVMHIGDPFGQAVAYGIFWIIFLYTAMVVLRRLGLFCYRHAIILDWFPSKSRPAR